MPSEPHLAHSTAVVSDFRLCLWIILGLKNKCSYNFVSKSKLDVHFKVLMRISKFFKGHIAKCNNLKFDKEFDEKRLPHETKFNFEVFAGSPCGFSTSATLDRRYPWFKFADFHNKVNVFFR